MNATEEVSTATELAQIAGLQRHDHELDPPQHLPAGSTLSWSDLLVVVVWAGQQITEYTTPS